VLQRGSSLKTAVLQRRCNKMHCHDARSKCFSLISDILLCLVGYERPSTELMSVEEVDFV
jgi:hypothetical protein